MGAHRSLPPMNTFCCSLKSGIENEEKNRIAARTTHGSRNSARMRKFNPFRSKLHHAPERETAASLKTDSKANSWLNPASVTLSQSITISEPISSPTDTVAIVDPNQAHRQVREDHTASVDGDNSGEQVSVSEELEKVADACDHTDDQVDEKQETIRDERELFSSVNQKAYHERNLSDADSSLVGVF